MTNLPENCPHRITRDPQRFHKGGTALRIEVMDSGSPRCILQRPSNWPEDTSGLRWLASGGEATVFGPCCARRCPLPKNHDSSPRKRGRTHMTDLHQMLLTCYRKADPNMTDQQLFELVRNTIHEKLDRFIGTKPMDWKFLAEASNIVDDTLRSLVQDGILIQRAPPAITCKAHPQDPSMVLIVFHGPAEDA